MQVRSYLYLGLAGVLICEVLGLRSQAETQAPMKTLRLSVAEKVSTLDPARVDDVYSAGESAKAYEGLFQFHYLKRPYQVVPNLAAEMPEISSKGRRYLFKLKQGVRFVDDPCFKGGQGRELSSEDVIYSIKRIADPAIQSPLWRTLDGKIVGLNKWREAAVKRGSGDYSLPVSGLKAKSAKVIEIELTRPFHQLSFVLAMPSAGIVAREAVEFYGSRFSSRAVGTGPFVLNLSESDLNSRLVWDRNLSYRREVYPTEGETQDVQEGLLRDAGRELPRVDRIEVRVIGDPRVQWQTFEKGELDLTEVPKVAPVGLLTPTKELETAWKKRGYTLKKQVAFDLGYVAFNLSVSPFKDNLLLRQALSMAVDIDPLIDKIYGGRAIPAASVVPPGLPSYDVRFKNPYRKFDLAQAKDLLAKAGFPGGKGLAPLTYLGYRRTQTNETSSTDPLADFLKRSFDQIGVKLEIRELGWSEFSSAIKAGKGQLWSLLWSYEYPEIGNSLQLFSDKGSTQVNETGYRSEVYDRLFEKFQNATIENDRSKISSEMLKVLSEDCPWIWLVHQLRFRLSGPRIGNLKHHDFDYGYTKYLSIVAKE